MSQSLSQIDLHIIFSTKNRGNLLQNDAVRHELHAYLGGVYNNFESPSLIVGGAVDHVHLLTRLSRTLAVSDFVRELKRESSKWLKERGPGLEDFHWQAGYGAFSISPGHVELLRKYIANQEEHHKRESFQEEFRRILRKYGVSYDERYVWD